jgi:hypothetical protein
MVEHLLSMHEALSSYLGLQKKKKKERKKEREIVLGGPDLIRLFL